MEARSSGRGAHRRPLAEHATLSAAEVYRALARRIPDPDDPSRLIDNPNVMWRGRTIDVLAPSDATVRELFVQLVMEPGCESYPSLRELQRTDRRTMLEGAAPTRGSLEDGTYSAARPVYAYAARDPIRNPAGMGLAFELSSEWAVGRYGYLGRLGLIPLDQPERGNQQSWPSLPRLESLQSSEEHRR